MYHAAIGNSAFFSRSERATFAEFLNLEESQYCHQWFGLKELLTPLVSRLGQRENDCPILNPSCDAHQAAVPEFFINPSSFRKALIVAE